MATISVGEGVGLVGCDWARLVGTGAIVLVSLGVATVTHAQDSLAAARFALTGPVEREWVFKQIQVFLGPGNHCQQGEALLFLASNKVVIESCANGQMINRTVDWTLRPNGVLDPILTFDGAEYELLFKDKVGKHYMRLRKRGADLTNPAVDRVFRLAEP
jgi:hypothetical protein